MKIIGKTFIAPPSEYKYGSAPEGAEIPPEGGHELPPQLEGDIGNLFNPTPAEGEVSPPNPFISRTPDSVGAVDPVTGEPVETPPTYGIPALDEVLKNGVKAEFKEDFAFLKTTERVYREKLNYFSQRKEELLEILDGEDPLNAAQIADINKKIAELEKAIAACEDSLDLLPIRRQELERMYEDEVAKFKEIATAPMSNEPGSRKVFEEFNKAVSEKNWKDVSKIVNEKFGEAAGEDGWIGEWGKGFRIAKDKAKVWVLVDRDKNLISHINETGMPSTNFMLDPGYEYKPLFNGTYAAEAQDSKFDLTLEVEKIVNTENLLDLSVEWRVPEVMLVKADENGKPIFKKTTGDESSDGMFRLIPREVGDDLSQKTLGDEGTEGWGQVRIVKQILSTNDRGDHEITLIAMVDGAEVTAAKFKINSGAGYGFIQTGKYMEDREWVETRESPIITDATGFKPSRKIPVNKEKLYSLLNSEYGFNFNELSRDEKLAADDTLHKIIDGIGAERKTGLISLGLSGGFELAENTNNLIMLQAPDRDAQKGDALYQSVVVGKRDFNAVFAKKEGDVYASNVTLFHRENNPSQDEYSKKITALSTPGIVTTSIEGIRNTINPRVFVNVPDGNGDISIDNRADKLGGLHESNDDVYNIGRDGRGGTYSLPFTTPDGKAGDPDAGNGNFGGPDDSTFGAIIYNGAGEIPGIYAALKNEDSEKFNPTIDLVFDEENTPNYYEKNQEMSAFYSMVGGLFRTGDDDSDNEDE